MAAILFVGILAALWASGAAVALANAEGHDNASAPDFVTEPAATNAEPSDELQQVVEDVVPRVEDYTLPDGLEYAPGVVLVCVDKGSDESDVAQALAARGVESVDAQSVTMLSESIAQVDVVPGATVEEAIGELRASGVVNDACPDVILHTVDTDDVQMTDEGEVESEQAQTLGGEALSMEDEAGSELELVTAATEAAASEGDPYATYQWAHASMDVSSALEYVNRAGAQDRSVGVAIIDSAFQVNHPDLLANQVVVYDAVAQTENPDPVENDQGEFEHGTHVAGIVGAVANNGVGVAGVAGNKARILLMRVSDAKGSIKTSTVTKAYTYLKEHASEYNIRVANLSLGIKWPDKYNVSILNSIESAYLDYGIVTVGAAGNAELATVPFRCYPSDYYAIVSVANLSTAFNSVANQNANIVKHKATSQRAGYLYTATNAKDVRLANDSNYNVPGGKGVNIAAPGSSILSLLAASTSDGVYGYISGTSMAAPQVTGVLSLMFAANPQLAASDARNALFMTARDLGDSGWDERFGYGEANALGAVQAAVEGVVQGPDFLGVGQKGTYTAPAVTSWSSAASSDPTVLAVDERGNATARKAGVAQVTITADESSAMREVCVVGPMQGGDYVAVGGSTQLGLIEPAAAGKLGWNWVSSDKDLATVTSDGVVFGHKAGTVTITATLAADANVSFSKQMRVYQPLLAEGAVACGHTAKLSLGDDVPQDGLLSYVWTSGDEGVATVDKGGYVTGVSAGSTTLTWVGTFEGQDDKVTYVYPLRVFGPLSGDSQMDVKGKVTLSILGADGDLAKGWTWTSSDTSVATVSGGVVSGVGAGSATIRATRGDVSFAKTIRVKALTKVRAPSSVSYAYAGKGLWCNLDGAGYRLSGKVHAKDVGTYYVTAWLNDGYVWSDGSSSAKRISWSITKARLTATYVSQRITKGGAAAGSVRVSGFVGYDTAKNAAGYRAPTVRITDAQRNRVGSYKIKPSGGAAQNYVFTYVAGTLTVAEPPTVAVTRVTLNKTSLTTRPKGTATLVARVSPSNATNKTVRWKSSNAKVAKVSSTGKVTGVSVGTATITATAGAKSVACKVTVKLPAAHVAYRAHVQGRGWLGSVRDGRTGGTTGESKRVEAVRIRLVGAPYAGTIEYRCHAQGVGWQDWVRDGAVGGTTGKSARLEAIRIRLTGTMARYYDVRYRVHVQSRGWTGWTKNGSVAGTVGQSLRLEAIQVRVVPKG